jgi:hypothetical protein
MTWKQFKELMDECGVLDTDEIDSIETGDMGPGYDHAPLLVCRGEWSEGPPSFWVSADLPVEAN